MSSPGELDRQPIKVVPIYLDPVAEEPPLEPEEPGQPDAEPTPPRRRRAARRSPTFLGPVTAVAAVVVAVLTGIAVSVASSGGYEAGAALAWVSIVLSGATVLAAIAAAVFGWGRRWAIGAIVIAVGANPWVLTSVLSLLAPA